MDARSMMADLSDEELAEREVSIDAWFEEISWALDGRDARPPRPIKDPDEWEQM